MLKPEATKIYCNVDENESFSRLLGIKCVPIDYVFVAATKVIEYFSKKFILKGNFIRIKSIIKN